MVLKTLVEYITKRNAVENNTIVFTFLCSVSPNAWAEGMRCLPIWGFHHCRGDHALTPPPGPYTVREVTGKGLGVFASRQITRGEQVFMEQPFFYIFPPCTQGDEKN